MKTLHEIGYEGPVVNEGRIRGEDPAESISGIRRLYETVYVIK